MPLLEITLFILSSGILFAERVRHNKFAIFAAATIAIISSLSLIWSWFPASSTGAGPDSHNVAESEEAHPQMTRAAEAERQNKITALPKGDCGEDIPQSYNEQLDRFRNEFDNLESIIRANRCQGVLALREKHYQLADLRLSIAINNEEIRYQGNPQPSLDRILRGIARAKDKKFEAALQDCEAFTSEKEAKILKDSEKFIRSFEGKSGDDGHLTYLGIAYECAGLSYRGLGNNAKTVKYLDLAVKNGALDTELLSARIDAKLAVGDKEGAESDRKLLAQQIVQGLFSQ